MDLGWPDVNLRLRTIGVNAKPDLHFFPKRWEERKVPVPVRLANILERHPQTNRSVFMFPSLTGNREQDMLHRCKAVAERAGRNGRTTIWIYGMRFSVSRWNSPAMFGHGSPLN